MHAGLASLAPLPAEAPLSQSPPSAAAPQDPGPDSAMGHLLLSMVAPVPHPTATEVGPWILTRPGLAKVLGAMSGEWLRTDDNSCLLAYILSALQVPGDHDRALLHSPENARQLLRQLSSWFQKQ